MKKQTILKITNDDGTSETIPCHIQKTAIFKTRGNSYRGRKTIKGHGRKWFTSDVPNEEDAWRDINEQCHHFKGKGKRSVIKVNKYPSLLKVVNAMLITPFTTTEIKAVALHCYADGLARLTKHLSGKEPEWEKIDVDGVMVRQYKAGSKWDNIRTNHLNQKLVSDFRADYLKGYGTEGEAYEKRARGANGVLKDAKSVFGKKLMKRLYVPLFKMSDITEFKEVEELSTEAVTYTAPKQKLMDTIMSHLEELKEQCIDTWLTFVLSYSAGFRWAETRHAHWSWMYEEEHRNNYNEVVTRYVIEVKPTATWKPKGKSVGKVFISKKTYDDIQATRYVSRDKLPNLSLVELQELVWSKPAIKAAKQLNISSRGLALRCGRLGIPTPPNGFWRRVETGKIPHPNGTPPEGIKGVEPNVVSFEEGKDRDGHILQRYRGTGRCFSSGNRRLAIWMRKLGWDRQKVSHEMRKLHGAKVVTATGSIYEGQRSLRHASYRTTEKYYADLVTPSDYTVDIPPSDISKAS